MCFFFYTLEPYLKNKNLVMKKGTLLFLFSLFITSSVLFAQTLAERQEITRNYNLEKLAQMEADYTSEFNVEKQKALDLAAINGWEEVLEFPNGGISMLVGIHENGLPKYITTHNREGGITTSANLLHTGGSSGLNLNGENMIIGIWDGGRVRGTHPLLENRVTQIDNPTSYSDHSTHVSGTMIGTGTVVGGAAKGMAPVAEILAYDFNTDTGEMTGAAAAGMILSNHSYGMNIANASLWQLGYYDSKSRSVDNLTYNAPYYLPIFSAGNDRQSGVNTGDGGYDYLTDAGCAKNNIVVAAVREVLNYTGPSSVIMSSFSSWGPTDDGRVKPDVSAKGVSMYSSVGTSGYANYDGTSMATPNTSGSLLLLQQHYNNVNGNYMLSSTLRGLALHTADEAGTAPGPDYRFGWGLLNVNKAAEVISNNGTSSIIIEEELLSGEVYTFSVQADGVNDLVASLTWTDPAGVLLPSGVEDDSTPSLINDLDLRVSQDGGATFYPWKLDPSNFSAAATQGDNLVDNIEKTEIAGASGEYIIQVSHKGGALANGGQVFSLIISGINKEEFLVSTHNGIQEACAVNGSAEFNIDLGFNDGFSDTINFTVASVPSGTTGSIVPTSLNSEGTAVLTLNGIGSLALGDYPVEVTATGSSETVTLYMTLRIISDTPQVVGLIYPADGAVDLPVVINFVWESGDPIVDNYDFELSRDETFSNIQFSENVDFPTVQILGVTEGAEYFWRVKPNTICTDGEYSEVFSFVVEGILNVNEQTIEGLVAYPNPSKGTLHIESKSLISSVEVMNVLGQVMFFETVSSNKTQIDISTLSTGNYFVRVTADNASDVLQIIKE
jgi:hypothetical protein